MRDHGYHQFWRFVWGKRQYGWAIEFYGVNRNYVLQIRDRTD